jgi:hypothetical protein
MLFKKKLFSQICHCLSWQNFALLKPPIFHFIYFFVKKLPPVALAARSSGIVSSCGAMGRVIECRRVVAFEKRKVKSCHPRSQNPRAPKR